MAAFRIELVELRAWKQSAFGASALAIAIVLGGTLSSKPARAACAFEGSFGGIVCSAGDADGFRDPAFNNSKIQVQTGANINHFANAFTIGANNTFDSAGDIEARDTAISASGNLIFNNTGTVGGRVGVSVASGDLEMTNTRNITSLQGVSVNGHVKLTNSGTFGGLGAVSANTAAVFNTGNISSTFVALEGRTEITVTNEGTISADTPAGLAFKSDGKVTIVNTGRVNGSTLFGTSGTITNTGEIFGPTAAPAIQAGDPSNVQPGVTLKLDNGGILNGAGIVQGVAGAVIEVTNSGSVTNRGAAFSKPAGFGLTSGTLTITNSGTLNTDTTSGALVRAGLGNLNSGISGFSA